MTHHPECEDATGEYPGSCTCALIKRREAMDDLIAQDADLIDVEAVARALAKVDRIEICSDATYALSSYGYKARAAIAAMPDMEAVKAYWYRQGKDDGVEHERSKIVAWLRGFATDYADDLADILEADETFTHPDNV